MEIKATVVCSDGKTRYPRTFVSKSQYLKSLEEGQKNISEKVLGVSVVDNEVTEKFFKKIGKISNPETSRRVVPPIEGGTLVPLGGVHKASYPSGGYFGVEIPNTQEFETSLQQFENAWDTLCEEFFGKRIPFFGKRIRNVKKAIAAYRAVLNAKKLNVEIKLYLRSHFDQAKQHPNVLRPAYLGSEQGTKTFQNWIKKFANKQDALNKTCHTDLEALLKQDHKNFLYHKNQANMTPHGIFRFMHGQFTHLYLVSYPEFLELLDRESGGLPPSFVTECRETLKRLERNPLDAMNYFKLVEAIKCQQT